jgi:hypothetical protein
MPILRESRDLKAEIPRSLQIENPPRFMVFIPLPNRNPATSGIGVHLAIYPRLNHLHAAPIMFFTTIATGMTTFIFI